LPPHFSHAPTTASEEAGFHRRSLRALQWMTVEEPFSALRCVFVGRCRRGMQSG
jgi:hypothetical protein